MNSWFKFQNDKHAGFYWSSSTRHYKQVTKGKKKVFKIYNNSFSNYSRFSLIPNNN